ncbi:hypothetical protein HK098_001584 [Nowakowskiella sp. JEL0407]|nr:hypothetical protein HK098_001584 [Nowakowskiella sp. JEL0407]
MANFNNFKSFFTKTHQNSRLNIWNDKLYTGTRPIHYVITRTVNLAFALSPIIAFYHYGYSVTSISGPSMKPTLNPDSDPSIFKRDLVLLDKFSVNIDKTLVPRFSFLTKRDLSADGTDQKSGRKLEQQGIRVGDIVVLISPINPKINLIKRVVALEGDWVIPRHSYQKLLHEKNQKTATSTTFFHRIANFESQSNDTIRSENHNHTREDSDDGVLKWPEKVIPNVSYLWNSYLRKKMESDDKPIHVDPLRLHSTTLIQVPPGHVWLESEEPYYGTDSNHFGPVPLALVFARVSHILLPFSRFGRLDRRETALGRIYSDSDVQKLDHKGEILPALTFKNGFEFER